MIDWSKPIQTVDGRRAKYVHTLEGGGGYPHVVVIPTLKYGVCQEEVVCVDDKGRSWHDEDNVTNAPVKHVRWVNFYPDCGPPDRAYETRDIADWAAGSSRIACIRVEFEEGEGL